MRRRLAGQLASRAPLPTRHFEIGVYFADGPVVSLGGVREWELLPFE